MSRNGSGTYNLPAGNPVVTGTTISSTWANNTLSDMANAITGSIAADGQTPITGALSGTNGTVSFAGVGQTKIPAGTTAQRATSPVNGMIRFNTDLNQYEGYRNGSWSIFGNGAGGTLFSDTVTATQGQTVITMPTGYVLGGDNLSVYVNGSRQIYNVNYTETTTDSFTFVNGLNAGDLVNYTIGASTSLSVNAASVLYNEGGTGAVDRNVEQKLQESVSVKDFGAVGDGVTDDTAAIQAACAASTAVHFPQGTYKVNFPESAPMVTYTSKSQVTITGDSALIYDTRNYTPQVINAVFAFVSCSNISVTGLNYEGQPLANPADPTDGVGYTGATFINLSTACNNVIVDANIKYARYGIRAGDYTDAAQGYSTGITANLNTNECGYPVALYNSASVDLTLFSIKSHRTAYLAGVYGGRVLANFKDQYTAEVQVLLTDALVSVGVSRGCRNLDIKAYDNGSTTYTANSYCAGISLSRNDAGIIYENITFDTFVKSTDTVASTLGSFIINSGPGWNNSDVVKNIIVKGVADRSSQTITEPLYEVQVRTTDGTNLAIVDNISFENFNYYAGTTPSTGFYFSMPGLLNNSHFINSTFGTATPFYLFTNPTSNVNFVNSKLRGTFTSAGSDGFTTANFTNCVIANANYLPVAFKTFVNTSINSSSSNIRCKIIDTALSGASVTLTGAIPAACVVYGVNGIITTTITGASGYQVGISSDLTRYGNRVATAAGTELPAISASTSTTPLNYATATDLVITAKTSNFTGGNLRIAIYYIDFSNFTL